MHQKRGQITIFIILGIIMVASVSLFIYYKSSAQPEIEAAEEEIAPIKDFVESCIEITAKDGLTILGLNGGFIKFPPKIATSPFSYLATSPVEGLKNPYWWYSGINNTPTIEFMRQQLSEHVTEQLKACLNNFENFKEDFDIKELGNLLTATKINENDVGFEVTYPLLITSIHNESKFKITKFNVNLPIRLKAMYELASSIMGSEFREAFIEKKLIDLIVLDNSIPTTDVEVSCKKKEWDLESTEEKGVIIKEGLRDRLKRLLSINLPFIRVRNTKYDTTIFVPTPHGPETYANSYFNTHYIWYASDKKYPETHVGFTYDPKWQLELQGFPSDGRKLRSNGQKGTQWLSAFCLHVWHFTYDISFPVKVTIYDEKTTEHDEFTFIFAFKTLINHNKADRVSLASSPFRVGELIRSEEFCADTSHEITIIPEDAIEKLDIDDVEVTLICGGFECELGKVERDFNSGGQAIMRKNVPACVAGYLHAKKDSYLDAEIGAQTHINEPFTIPMTPIKEIKNYKVIKHLFDGKTIGLAQELSSDERVSITITNKDANFETFGTYPGNEFPIRLLAKQDNKYEVSAYLLNGPEIVGGYVNDWTVTWDKLKNANELILHVVVQEPLPKDETERFLFIGALNTYSKNIQSPEIR